jgi:hypothetical protein
MLPALCPGDVILVRRCAGDDTAPGDLVLFATGERLFVHRVIRVDRDLDPPIVITRGDMLKDDDEPIHATRVMGRVVIATRGTTIRHSPFPHSRTSVARAKLTEAVRGAFRTLAGRQGSFVDARGAGGRGGRLHRQLPATLEHRLDEPAQRLRGDGVGERQALQVVEHGVGHVGMRIERVHGCGDVGQGFGCHPRPANGSFESLDFRQIRHSGSLYRSYIFGFGATKP